MKKTIIWLVISIAISIIVGLSSCRSARDLFDSALKKDSSVVAAESLKLWPCVDGAVRPTDSVEYKIWKQKYLEAKEFYDSLFNNIVPDTLMLGGLTDTVYIGKKELAQLKQKNQELLKMLFNQPTLHDTLPVTDEKAVYLAHKERDQYREENLKLKQDYNNLQDKLSKRNKQLITESSILLILLILLIYKLWIKLRKLL